MRRASRSEAGYNLVAVIVAITVMSILVAAALPAWSHRIRRAKEEEAIFRGLQYAEAIRVFQKRFNRFPTRLEELLEVSPRSIRQLWTDPLSEHGRFGVLVSAEQPAASGRQGAGQNAQAAPDAQTGQTPPAAGSARGQGQGGALIRQPRVDENGKAIEVVGRPIHGVYVDLEGEATREFLGESDYSKWDFTVEMIPVPQVVGGRPIPSVRSDWIGKPFPKGLASGGSGPAEGRSLVGPDADGAGPFGRRRGRPGAGLGLGPGRGPGPGSGPGPGAGP